MNLLDKTNSRSVSELRSLIVPMTALPIHTNFLSKFPHLTRICANKDSAKVQHACSNGHAICKDLSLSPTYNQWSFFTCNKVSPLNNPTPKLTSVLCTPINQLKVIRGTCKAPNKEKTTSQPTPSPDPTHFFTLHSNLRPTNANPYQQYDTFTNN